MGKEGDTGEVRQILLDMRGGDVGDDGRGEFVLDAEYDVRLVGVR
jgi:hypothetical protein